MTTFHIAGDGVAGLMLARALTDGGADVVLHGDGRAGQQGWALVHRFPGRSFRTSPLDDDAWALATELLDGLVECGAALHTPIARPLGSRAGERLEASREHAPEAAVERVGTWGDCFVYGPAYAVNVGAALAHIGEGLPRSEGRTERDDAVLAVGADLDLVPLDRYGGHLVEFDGEVPMAVSGGGAHAVPTTSGVCVGSTWWDPADPLDDASAVAELRRRMTDLGVELGAVRRIWRGIRAVNPLDRRPFAGRVAGRFVVGGLGTRGWGWMPLLAKEAAGALLKGSPIRPELDVARCPVGQT